MSPVVRHELHFHPCTLQILHSGHFASDGSSIGFGPTDIDAPHRFILILDQDVQPPRRLGPSWRRNRALRQAPTTRDHLAIGDPIRRLSDLFIVWRIRISLRTTLRLPQRINKAQRIATDIAVQAANALCMALNHSSRKEAQNSFSPICKSSKASPGSLSAP